MAKTLDDIQNIPLGTEKIPLETENGLNLDHPLVFLFRRLMLEQNAEIEKSNLYCPSCKAHLPYNSMTAGQSVDFEDIGADGRPAVNLTYYCPLCEKSF